MRKLKPVGFQVVVMDGLATSRFEIVSRNRAARDLIFRIGEAIYWSKAALFGQRSRTSQGALNEIESLISGNIGVFHKTTLKALNALLESLRKAVRNSTATCDVTHALRRW